MGEKWMRRALELARLGSGYVSPNPMVGAVVVRGDKVLAEGWHKVYGGPHAEVVALNQLDDDLSDCTMYVTLEPCSHFGKTPPCADRIIESGIRHVVIAMSDPNPLVAGRGVKKMKEAGVKVEVGLLEREAKELNKAFVKHITQKTPYVVMKTAMTLDGKIAAAGGDSKWVTSAEARGYVHRMRHDLKGIMVGIGTVLADDPMLNVRTTVDDPVHPIRIVADTHGRIPLDSALVRSAWEIPLIVAVADTLDKAKIQQLKDAGAEVITVPKTASGLDLKALMLALGQAGVDSILLEGGGTLNWSMLEQNLVDEVCAFIAPKIVGGSDAKTPVEGKGHVKMREAIAVSNWTVEPIGPDLLIRGRTLKKERD